MKYKLLTLEQARYIATERYARNCQLCPVMLSATEYVLPMSILLDADYSDIFKYLEELPTIDIEDEVDEIN